MPMKEFLSTMRGRLSGVFSSLLQTAWYVDSPRSLPRPWHLVMALGARLYAIGLQRDQRLTAEHPRELPVYVISVGNLVVGGAGKTPLSLWLAEHLRGLGWKPAIISRGYKKKNAGSAKVSLDGESSVTVLDYGDEPVFMAHRAKPIPVWVGKNRWVSGSLALKHDDADVLILDDGFQHLALRRNLDLVLLDAHNPFGNGALLPLGPLREPPEHLRRADAIVLTRADHPEKTAKTRSMIAGSFPTKPIFSCIHRLSGLRMGIDGRVIPLERLRDRKAVAFAGIARPEGFFQLLKQAGVVLSRCLSFPDHHLYQGADLLLLRNHAVDCGTPFLITTEKDMVRLPPEFQEVALAALLELNFLSDHLRFCDFLKENLPPRVSTCCSPTDKVAAGH